MNLLHRSQELCSSTLSIPFAADFLKQHSSDTKTFSSFLDLFYQLTDTCVQILSTSSKQQVSYTSIKNSAKTVAIIIKLFRDIVEPSGSLLSYFLVLSDISQENKLPFELETLKEHLYSSKLSTTSWNLLVAQIFALEDPEILTSHFMNHNK